MSADHPFHNATIPIIPFRLSHTQQQVDDMKTLIRLSPLGPKTYENDPARNEKMGISMQSMQEIKDAWLEYDWLARQEELNETLPQYVAKVVDTDPKTGKKHTFDVHFVGKMSEEKDAIPLILLHGWPGMGLFELTPMIEALEKAGAPPLHLIIME
jgi:microsomal epoxide hydrolase